MSGADWAAAYSATLAYARAYDNPTALHFEHPCSNDVDRECLNQRARLSTADRVLSLLLPVFEFKTVDQFDFIQRGGGRFLTSPLSDSTLETYTVTWDLSRVFGGSKERLEVLTALGALEKVRRQTPPSVTWRQGVRIPARPNELLYLQFESKGGVAPVTWAVQESTCATEKSGIFLGARLSNGGLLSGYPENLGSDCRFTLRLSDSVGQSDLLSCRVLKRQVLDSTRSRIPD